MCGWGAVRTWSVLLGWKPIMEPPFSPYSHPALLTTSLSLSPALICSLLDCKKLKSRNCSLLILTPPSHQLPLSCSLSFSGHPMSIVWAIASLTSQLMIVANARQEPSFAQKAIKRKPPFASCLSHLYLSIQNCRLLLKNCCKCMTRAQFWPESDYEYRPLHLAFPKLFLPFLFFSDRPISIVSLLTWW